MNMQHYWNNDTSLAFDIWKTTDVESQLAWDAIYQLEWAESLIRQEHPSMDEYDIHLLATERLANGYYDTLDF
jgi:hypothetical protein